ncbi:hypothetical protein GCM10027217_33760 [Pseudomaricurvus hydrocarbonicus]
MYTLKIVLGFRVQSFNVQGFRGGIIPENAALGFIIWGLLCCLLDSTYKLTATYRQELNGAAA